MATSLADAQQTLTNLESVLGKFQNTSNIFGVGTEFDKLVGSLRDANIALAKLTQEIPADNTQPAIDAAATNTQNKISFEVDKAFDTLLGNKDWVVENNGNLQLNVNNLSLRTNFSGGLPNLTAAINSDVSLSAPGNVSLGFDVGLDTGTFVSNFAKPVFSQVSKVIKPLEDINRILTTNVPGLDKIYKINLLDIASVAEPDATRALRTFFNSVNEVTKLVKVANNLSANGVVSLGSFSLNKDGLTNSIPNNSINLGSSIQGFLDQAKSTSLGFSFPIIEKSQAAFDLLLGKENIDLFRFKIQPVQAFTARYSLSRRIPLPPLKGILSVNFSFDGSIGLGTGPIEFGFDTAGLKDLDPLKGLFINSENPIFRLTPRLALGVELSATVAAVTGRGGVDGNVNFFLPSTPDNKFRISAKPDFSNFEVNGNVDLFLDAGFRIGPRIRIFRRKLYREFNQNIFRTTLFKFGNQSRGSRSLVAPSFASLMSSDINSDIVSQTQDNSQDIVIDEIQSFDSLNFSDIKPNITLQSQNGDIYIDLQGQDGGIDEIRFSVNQSDLTISTVSDMLDFGIQDSTYSNVSKIIAFTGGADDTILIDDMVNILSELNGEAGEDTLIGGANTDKIWGGTENDELVGNDGNDFLYGDEGDDDLMGDSGIDALFGGAGDDDLDGGAGDDNLDGGSDSDFIFGDDGVDTLKGGSEDDFLFGGSEGDFLFGDSGNDYLSGDENDDYLYGGTGEDYLSGGEGNDFLRGDDGNDDISGGNGDSDTVSYETSSGSVVANIDDSRQYSNTASEGDLETTFTIDAGKAQDGFGFTDSFNFLIEEEETTDEDVKVIIEGKEVTLPEQKVVGTKTVEIFGGLENLIGSNQSDVLIGNSKKNVIQGLGGDDLLIGNEGVDTLDGANGNDTVSYRRDAKRVIVNLETNTAIDGSGAADTLVSIENVVGSDSTDEIIGDEITGDSNANIILGGKGNDILKGGIGNDILKGEADNDQLFGGQGNDLLDGGTGDDQLDGSDGNDIIRGGLGIDTAIYNGRRSRYSITRINGGFTITSNDTGEGVDTLSYDVEKLQFSDQIVSVNPAIPRLNNDVFSVINGSKAKPSVQFTVNSNGASQLGELGVFVVDDADGKIDGIAPNDNGYAQKALSRAKVIFSAIDNNPNGFSSNGLSRLLEFNKSDKFRFYAIGDRTATTDSVLASGNFSKVNFSTSTLLNFNENDGGSFINFNNLTINVKPSDDELPIGTGLQDQKEGEVLDLTKGFDTKVFSQVKADFTVNREAGFNNFVGFYKIENAKGDIKRADGSIVSVGQSGYIQAAVAGQVSGIDLSVDNQSTKTTSGIFNSGSIFAPFIIVNGNRDAILDNNPNNDPAVYFPFLGANSDKVDHIRLLGNNTFGFEDLAGGGDFDYNDIIVKVKLTPVA
jgi:Ca2+-binding RTX toxin-like protein